MTKHQITFGNVPVPYVASWSEEEHFFLDICPHAKGIAICQAEKRGAGKPMFGKPHMNRQREAVIFDLCDLCGGTLRNRTKVSLSHARPRSHGAAAFDILQVEPLLHKECAAISLRHCPSLRRDIRAGSLEVRQVLSHRTQIALYSEQGTFEATGVRRKSFSHAKVQLLSWKDRSERWLDQ